MKRKFYTPPLTAIAAAAHGLLLSDSTITEPGGTSGGGGIIGAKAWRKEKPAGDFDDFDDSQEEDTVKWTTKRKSLWDE